MAINNEIVNIVDEALAGAGLGVEKTAKLFSQSPYSAEGAYIRWGGYMLSRKASDGIAEVYAQIGMDASTCPLHSFPLPPLKLLTK